MTDQPLPRSGKDRNHAPPAFQFYPADFLGGRVSECSLEETGAYMILLCHAWTAGSIPDNERGFARLLGVSGDDARRLHAALRPFFSPTEDGRLIQPRMERERALNAAYRERQRANGRKGGRPKNPLVTSGLTHKQSQTKAKKRSYSESYSESESYTDSTSTENNISAPDGAPVSMEVESLLDRFDEALPAICASAKRPRRTKAQRDAAARLIRAHGDASVRAIIDFYAGPYRAATDFDWREHITSLVYVERKWPKLDGERARQIAPNGFGRQRDLRVGHAPPDAREAFTATREIDL